MEDFESFYNKYKIKLFSYLIRISGDYDLAMDILQDSFTRYFEKYGKKTRNVPLLYTIARNCFLDHKRKSARDLSLEYSTEKDHEDPSRNQGEMFQIKQEYRRVLSAMEKLEDDEREILSLVITENLNYREIASLVGVTEANIKVKVHRARVKMKKILKTGDFS